MTSRSRKTTAQSGHLAGSDASFLSNGDYSPGSLSWDQCGQFVKTIVENRLPRSIRRNLGVSDVVQSVLCLIQAKQKQFRGTTQAEFRGWVMRIAERKVIDGIRRYRRKTVSLDDQDTGEMKSLKAGSTTGESPSEQIEVQEQVRQMLGALSQLPDQQRQVVTLRYLKNMTFEQIAAEMNISTTTCRRRWMDAITRISSRLDTAQG